MWSWYNDLSRATAIISSTEEGKRHAWLATWSAIITAGETGRGGGVCVRVVSV